MRGRPKPRKGDDMLAWRSRQPRGAIMKPSTFEEIMEDALKSGLSKARAKAVAGRTYWNAVEAKYNEAKKRRK